MRLKPVLITLTAFLVCTGARAQSLLPHKDMVFAQVAVGDSIETRITLTNRGTSPYLGTLFLVKNQGEDWNAIVNGVQISKGATTVSISPGATTTLRINGTDTQAGFAILAGSQMTTSNCLDGNLTYYVKSGSAIVDSIGVADSTEIYFSSIPFENFSTIALALANIDAEERTTNVSITLFTENGTTVATKTIPLGPFWHKSFFVRELFTGITMAGKGHLEVQSDIAICGTALNVVDGQMSSLPVSPTGRVYNLRATASDGTSFSGQANLWAEGFFVKGFMIITEAGGTKITPEPYLVYGRLIKGVLRLSFYAKGKAFQDREVSVYTTYRDFSFEANSLLGTLVVTYLNENSTSTGSFQLTKTN